MAIKKFIVTVVDTSNASDYKPSVAKILDTEEEAKAYVKEAIEGYVADADGRELVVDFDKMSVHACKSSYGCEWNIDEEDIEIKEPSYADRLNKLRNDIENDVTLSYRTKTTMIECIMRAMSA